MAESSTTYYCPLCNHEVGNKSELEIHISKTHQMRFAGYDDMVRRMSAIGFAADDFKPQPKKPKESTQWQHPPSQPV
ncbi:hypothetical protein [Delftia phage PhiW-14]|uniref:C2H2-type domain-containing protein n=1 Tax=Delftia phage PhiW-14 TaxID=665032 RepID=C9DGK4_BPW14|nr:hypothetical protein DP-phiW-14_gp234 [Delftia phage PhiW-14]ACV50255.1 hypothetical protein [Delftia phage PhiW-14]